MSKDPVSSIFQIEVKGVDSLANAVGSISQIDRTLGRIASSTTIGGRPNRGMPSYAIGDSFDSRIARESEARSNYIRSESISDPFDGGSLFNTSSRPKPGPLPRYIVQGRTASGNQMPNYIQPSNAGGGMGGMPPSGGSGSAASFFGNWGAGANMNYGGPAYMGSAAGGGGFNFGGGGSGGSGGGGPWGGYNPQWFNINSGNYNWGGRRDIYYHTDVHRPGMFNRLGRWGWETGTDAIGSTFGMVFGGLKRAVGETAEAFKRLVSPMHLLNDIFSQLSFKGILATAGAMTQRGYVTSAMQGVNVADPFRMSSTYGRYADIPNLLSSLGQEQRSLFSYPLAMSGIGYDKARRMDTDALSIEMLRKARAIARSPQWGRSLDLAASVYGFDQIGLGATSLARLANTSDEEWNSVEEFDRQKKGIKFNNLQHWRDFNMKREIGALNVESGIANLQEKHLLGPIENTINKFINYFQSKKGDVLDRTFSKAGGLITQVGNRGPGVIDSVLNKASQYIDIFSQKLNTTGSLLDATGAVFKQLWEDIKPGKEKIKELFTDIADAATPVFNKLSDSIKTAIESTLRTIDTIFPEQTRAFNELAVKAKDTLDAIKIITDTFIPVSKQLAEIIDSLYKKMQSLGLIQAPEESKVMFENSKSGPAVDNFFNPRKGPYPFDKDKLSQAILAAEGDDGKTGREAMGPYQLKDSRASDLMGRTITRKERIADPKLEAEIQKRHAESIFSGNPKSAMDVIMKHYLPAYKDYNDFVLDPHRNIRSDTRAHEWKRLAESIKYNYIKQGGDPRDFEAFENDPIEKGTFFQRYNDKQDKSDFQTKGAKGKKSLRMMQLEGIMREHPNWSTKEVMDFLNSIHSKNHRSPIGPQSSYQTPSGTRVVSVRVDNRSYADVGFKILGMDNATAALIA